MFSDFFVRQADLDDTEALQKLVTEGARNELDQLFDYPKMVTLFEKSFLSLTVLTADHRIIGAACFDDCPPGLRGRSDNLHYNLWEEWLSRAFNLEGLPISSANAVWMSFFFVA